MNNEVFYVYPLSNELVQLKKIKQNENKSISRFRRCGDTIVNIETGEVTDYPKNKFKTPNGNTSSLYLKHLKDVVYSISKKLNDGLKCCFVTLCDSPNNTYGEFMKLYTNFVNSLKKAFPEIAYAAFKEYTKDRGFHVHFFLWETKKSLRSILIKKNIIKMWKGTGSTHYRLIKNTEELYDTAMYCCNYAANSTVKANKKREGLKAFPVKAQMFSSSKHLETCIAFELTEKEFNSILTEFEKHAETTRYFGSIEIFFAIIVKK